MSIQTDTWVAELRKKVAALEQQLHALEARVAKAAEADVKRNTLGLPRGKKA